MPPTPTASNPPKPKPGATGKGLGKKVGPFSLWVWLVMAGGVAVVGYLYLRNREAGDGGGGFVETVSGNQTASPVEQAYGGGPSGGYSDGLAGQVDPSTLDALVQQAVGPYLASAGDLRGHVYELEDAFANAGYTLNEDKTWTPPGNAYEAAIDATLGPPGGGPQATQAPAQGGVRWGGQTFTTKAGLAAFLAGSQGRGRAESYRDWATKHPGAAQRLSGPAPKPKPRSPIRKAPKPVQRQQPVRKQPTKKKQVKKKKVVAKKPVARGARR